MGANCREPAGLQSHVPSCGPEGYAHDYSDTHPKNRVEAAVDHYIEHHRARAARELEYFSRVLPTDQAAVERAARAQLPSGKRRPHQYRIPRTALEESHRRLVENLPHLRQATSFDELFEVVDAIISPIPGVGELTVYDTTLRIGARIGLAPTRVYLHAGARAGARLLGFSDQRLVLEMNELPAAMQRLSPREAEDLLCIYKIWLG